MRTVYRYKQAGLKGVNLHRMLAERAVGHPLPPSVEVHHVDGDVSSAAPRLVVCQDKAYHKLLHYRTKVLRAGGNPNTDKLCCDCGRVKPLSEFNVMSANKSNGRQSVCRDCSKVRDAEKRARRKRDREEAA